MADQSPDPWRLVWRSATSDVVLVALLLAVAASVTLTAWIPQQPPADEAYARWFSEMQARFGQATSVMRVLGLFNVTSSPGFRVLLALLSGSLLLRLIEGVDRLWRGYEPNEPRGVWRHISGQEFSELLDGLRRRGYRVISTSSLFQVDRWPWSGVLAVLIHLGGLLLLIGLLLSHLYGWQVRGLVLQEGERESLPGDENWVTLRDSDGGLRQSSGVVAFVQGTGPGVQVSATNGAGESLGLLLSPDAEPATELNVALTEDTYFAIPGAELIVHLVPQSEDAYTRVDVQVYSSPTGEVISERLTDEGGHTAFTVRDISLTFLSAPYSRVVAAHNPGRIPAGLGVMMLVVGTVGGLVWSEQCFWLREEEAAIEAAGSLPFWLQPEEEVA